MCGELRYKGGDICCWFGSWGPLAMVTCVQSMWRAQTSENEGQCMERGALDLAHEQDEEGFVFSRVDMSSSVPVFRIIMILAAILAARPDFSFWADDAVGVCERVRGS